MQAQLDYPEAIAEVDEIVKALFLLPAEKVAQVRDYVWFLQARYGHPMPVDSSDEWSEADTDDLTAASLAYAAQSFFPAAPCVRTFPRRSAGK